MRISDWSSDVCSSDPTRVVVFTGAGDAFSAGDDIKNHYGPEHWDQARTNDIFANRRLDQVGLYGRLRVGSPKLPTALRDIHLIPIAAINALGHTSHLTLSHACGFSIHATHRQKRDDT